MSLNTEQVQADLYFLSRDRLYEREKPYTLRFSPHVDIKQSNISREKHSVIIHNMRSLIDNMSFDHCGFGVMPIRSAMNYEDFANDAKIRSTYLDEITKELKGRLGAPHVFITDYTVSIAPSQ